MGERAAHDLGLLVNLLRHEVTVIALLGQQAAGLTADRGALNRLSAHVSKLRALACHNDPIAFLEIGDLVREGG